MITASRCRSVDFSRADAWNSGVWTIGVTLVLTVLALVLDKTLGDHVMIEALFPASLFIAMTVASRSTYLQPYSRTARGVIITLGCLAWYAFFVGMSVLAAAT